MANYNGIVNKRYNFLYVSLYNQGGIINGSMLALELMGRGYGGNGGVIINMSSVAGIHIKSSFVLVCLIEGESWGSRFIFGLHEQVYADDAVLLKDCMHANAGRIWKFTYIMEEKFL